MSIRRLLQSKRKAILEIAASRRTKGAAVRVGGERNGPARKRRRLPRGHGRRPQPSRSFGLNSGFGTPAQTAG